MQSLRPRRNGLDTIRGITLVSMILYHACWDLVYLFDVPWGWYRSMGAYLWQQSICWTFILLSGYCFHLGRHRIKRGLTTFAGGAVVSLATIIAMPDSLILFGVLTFLGSAMLLTIPLDRLFRRIPPQAGLVLSFVLFLLLRDVNTGWLGFEGGRLLMLPDVWYSNLFSAFLGFPAPSFSSSDYFSLLPWIFLFWTGYFLFRLQPEETSRQEASLPLFTFMGRHSLLIYMAHQPVIYGVLTAASLLLQW